METKRRTAYFGTDGCPGHYFKTISGEFSPQEEEELSKIDEDFQLFGFSGFSFFYLSGYDDTLHSVWNSDYLIDCAQETLLTIITLL